MRYLILVLFLFPTILSAQGGFGFRRFETTALLTASTVDNTAPSHSRRAYAHDTGYYYIWDGAAWQREQNLTIDSTIVGDIERYELSIYNGNTVYFDIDQYPYTFHKGLQENAAHQVGLGDSVLNSAYNSIIHPINFPDSRAVWTGTPSSTQYVSWFYGGGQAATYALMTEDTADIRQYFVDPNGMNNFWGYMNWGPITVEIDMYDPGTIGTGDYGRHLWERDDHQHILSTKANDQSATHKFRQTPSQFYFRPYGYKGTYAETAAKDDPLIMTASYNGYVDSIGAGGRAGYWAALGRIRLDQNHDQPGPGANQDTSVTFFVQKAFDTGTADYNFLSVGLQDTSANSIAFYNDRYYWVNGTPSTTLNDTTIHAWVGTGSSTTPFFMPFSLTALASAINTNVYNSDGNVKNGGSIITVDGNDPFIFSLNALASESNRIIRMEIDTSTDDRFAYPLQVVTNQDSLYLTVYDGSMTFDYQGPTGSGTGFTLSSNTTLTLTADSVLVTTVPAKAVLQTLWGGWGTALSSVVGSSTGQVLSWDNTGGYWELNDPNSLINSIYTGSGDIPPYTYAHVDTVGSTGTTFDLVIGGGDWHNFALTNPMFGISIDNPNDPSCYWCGVDLVSTDTSANNFSWLSMDGNYVIMRSGKYFGANHRYGEVRVAGTSTAEVIRFDVGTGVGSATTMAVDTTGRMILDRVGTNSGALRINNASGGNYTEVITPVQTNATTYTTPTDYPAADGYVLTSTTAGAWSWTDPSTFGGGGGGIYDPGTGTVPGQSVATLTDTLVFKRDSSLTAGLVDMLVFNASSSGTPAAGFGPSILFKAESATQAGREIARIGAGWEDAADATRDGKISIQLGNSGGALTEIAYFSTSTDAQGELTIGSSSSLRIDNDQLVPSTSFTVGGVAQAISIASSLGTSQAINIWNSSATGSIALNGGLTFGSTKTCVRHGVTFTASSGTGSFVLLDNDLNVNQTGTSSHNIYGYYDDPSLAGGLLGTYYALYLNADHANAKGVYQTGTSTTNNFAGNVNIGSLNAPASTPLTIEESTANTATVADLVTTRTNSTGVAANGFGSGILFRLESSTTDNQDAARITTEWTTATHASKEAKVGIQLGDSGGALAEIANFNVSGNNEGQLSIGSTTPVDIDNDGIIGSNTQFTINNGSNLLLLGNSTGSVQVKSTSNAIIDCNSSSGTGTTRAVQIGYLTCSPTSGDRYNAITGKTFAPTSGTATFRTFALLDVINQTGGANGATYGIDINPTLTSIGSTYYSLNIAVNNASAFGIYQSGTSTPNQLFGRTYIGGGATPTLLSFYEGSGSGTNSVSVDAPTTLSADWTMTLPTDGGSSGQILSTDGSGNTSWVNGTSLISPSQITSDQDDYSPTGWSTATIVRLSGDNGIRAITSMAAGTSGEIKTLINVGSYALYFPQEHPDGTAANRVTGCVKDYILFPGASTRIIYDGTSSRWRILDPMGKLEDYRTLFYQWSAGSSTAGDWGDWATNTSGGTLGTSAVTSTKPANVFLSTSTSATGIATMYFSKVALSDFAYWGAAHTFGEYMFQLQDTSTATETYQIDFTLDISASGTTDNNNILGVRYDYTINSGRFQCFTRNNVGTETTLDSGVDVSAGTIYKIRMEIDKSLTEARFYIDGTFVGRITTNLPTGQAFGTRAKIEKSNGTTASVMEMHSMAAGEILP